MVQLYAYYETMVAIEEDLDHDDYDAADVQVKQIDSPGFPE